MSAETKEQAAQSTEAQAAQEAAPEEAAPPREWPEGAAPEIIVFACHYCAYAAADLAGSMRLQYPPTIRIIKLPCTGKLEVVHVLKAFEAGADGVYAAGCMEGECHYLKGNLWARRRIGYVKKLLEELGLEPERVEMYNMSSAMGPRFAEVANEFTDRILALGPSPLRRHDVSPVEAAHEAVAAVGGQRVAQDEAASAPANVEEGQA
jgi:F420-non-reducing hydrogenase iron-sulfur subunit